MTNNNDQTEPRVTTDLRVTPHGSGGSDRLRYVSVSDSRYVSEHGRTPRGDGSWAFFADPACRSDPIWVTGTYSAAKRAARRIAAERGIRALWVGS